MPETTASLLTRPATELAELVRSGEVTSRELVEASLQRIDAVDGEVNAFVTVDGERALADADKIGANDPRPFAGVPFAMKDLFSPVENLPQSQGSRFFNGFTPGFDANVARRVREAGFVIVGCTNTPEFGIQPITEPVVNGPTRNPWDLDRTPGGSSGGSGAAVAAGMVPVAHASDGGGSIRIPAACCGLVGLKPSRGRVSPGPGLGEQFLSIDGSLTRTVGDTAAILDLLEGYELGDSSWATPPSEPFANAVGRDPGKLRIGLVTQPPLDVPVDEVQLQAALDAADLLGELGHEVEEFALPWRDESLFPRFSILWASYQGLVIKLGALGLGREPTEDFEPLTWAMYQQSLTDSAADLAATLVMLQVSARQMVVQMSAYDAILTPATARRPVRVGEIDDTGESPWTAFAQAGAFTPFTAGANLTGQPAISLPLFHGDDGLPTAIQLIGRPVGEHQLIELASQLETAQPWADRVAEL